jgi:E3 ubiquitin-protein ligase MUL1
MLQNAAVIDLNSSVEETVKTHPNQKLPYAAVRGQVKALGAPVISRNNWNTTGTIQKLSVKEHLIRRTSAGFWRYVEHSVQFVLALLFYTPPMK